MNKFQKRVSKILNNTNNCVVFGQGFGYLPMILEIFNSVFIIDDVRPELKARNLIYRENFDKAEQLSEIDAIFIDLSNAHRLEEVMPYWTRWHAKVLVEGNEPIGRDLSGPLYKTYYQCTSLQGAFHVWELKK